VRVHTHTLRQRDAVAAEHAAVATAFGPAASRDKQHHCHGGAEAATVELGPFTLAHAAAAGDVAQQACSNG